MSRELFLNKATEIGRQLVKNAVLDNDNCFWSFSNKDYSPQIKKNNLGPDIFRGNAGIALFLTELYNQTGEEVFINTAEAAIKFCILENSLIKPRCSFYFGELGLAYVATRFNIVTGSKNFESEIFKILTNQKLIDQNKDELDYFTGCAGTIPFLLYLGEIYNSEELIILAESKADFLIEQAEMEHLGWSWKKQGVKCKRNLCGFAHGASGIGTALFEVYTNSGKNKYLYAAEQAFVYERQFFNSKVHNWPDFRVNQLKNNDSASIEEENLKLWGNGSKSDNSNNYNNSISHGAPGIAISRMRAYNLLRDPAFEKESIHAMQSTIESLNVSQKEYSLYDGELGKFETLLIASRILRKQEYYDLAEEILLQKFEEEDQSAEKYGEGVSHQSYDAGLFTGIAGLGYSLLRFISDEVPSVILPFIEKEKRIVKGNELNYLPLQKKYISEHFGKTIKIADKLSLKYKPQLQIDFKIGRAISDIQIAHHRLLDFFTMPNSEQKRAVQAMFEIEEAAYKMQFEISDFSLAASGKYNSENDAESIDEKCFLQVARPSAILDTEINLEYILEAVDGAVDQSKINGENHWLLINKKNKVVLYPVTAFTATIIESLKYPTKFSELMAEIKKTFNIGDSNDLLFYKILKEQVRVLYSESLINQSYDLDEIENNAPVLAQEFKSPENSINTKSIETINQILLNAAEIESLEDDASRRLAINSLIEELDFTLRIMNIRNQFAHLLREFYLNQNETVFWELVEKLNSRLILSEVES